MVLVFNPAAGRGRSKGALAEVESQLRRRNLDYELETTSGPNDATAIARRRLEAGTTLVVAVGGDGTLNEVINGMIEGDAGIVPGATVGVVPAGRASDFTRTFGIPKLPAHAAAHLDGPGSFPIDIGKITLRDGGVPVTRYFANVAEAGMGAAVARRVHGMPAWLGPMDYLFAFWSVLARFSAAAVSVDLIDRTYEGPALNVVVANGQFFGGGMKIAPKAAPTDGVLDIQIQLTSKREAIALLPKVYKGEHVPHEHIKEAKRVKVSVTAEPPFPVEADGELIGQTPATFEVLPNALHLKV